jgi:hypothetical protein
VSAKLVLVRLGMWLLGLVYLAWGVPAMVAPQWFFDHFPGVGRHWTAAYPPYNEHLTTDLGVAAVTLGGMLIAAALIADRKVTALVLTVVAFYEALHLIYHVLHDGRMSASDHGLSLIALSAGVLFPLALLTADRIRSPRDRRG